MFLFVFVIAIKTDLIMLFCDYNLSYNITFCQSWWIWGFRYLSDINIYTSVMGGKFSRFYKGTFCCDGTNCQSKYIWSKLNQSHVRFIFATIDQTNQWKNSRKNVVALHSTYLNIPDRWCSQSHPNICT